ncbi:MAG: PilZ domain-containing protein [Geobacteraceae bacterium]|nr:PilZ domain-containing protein [Geobacteraceae bacterium]
MSNSDRRYVRMESLNLLDYVLVDEKGEIVTRAMGRTLNISEKGILLETHLQFEPGQVLLITIGLEEDLVDLKGLVKHAEERDDKTFSAGIEFLEFDGEGSRVLHNYLEAFEAFKN